MDHIHTYSAIFYHCLDPAEKKNDPRTTSTALFRRSKVPGVRAVLAVINEAGGNVVLGFVAAI